MSVEVLPVSRIRRDGGTQPRASLNDLTVDEYVEALGNGAEFPPVTVFYDGRSYWLADGFHRVEAHERVGAEEIRAEVRQGERRNAVLHSVGANADHGLPRSRADKRRAVETLLRDPEWSSWSNRAIAEACRVSDPFVARVRASLTANVSSRPRTNADSETRIGRDGRAIDVSGLQARARPSPTHPPADDTDAGRSMSVEAQSPALPSDPAERPAGKSYTKPVEEREPLDAYYTPEGLPEALLKVTPFSDGYAWEPHAGGGSFLGPLRAMVEAGQLDGVFASDINPDAPAVRGAKEGRGVDFLTVEPADVPLPVVNNIIGNPPYAEAEAHVRRALELVEVGGVVAFLLRLGFLETIRRLPFWQEHPAHRIFVVVPRPSFTGDGATDGQAYAWFVWIKGVPAVDGMPIHVLDWRSGEVIP